jgi:tripartite-type tricarboxylate transporter receptor subunit TctC
MKGMLCTAILAAALVCMRSGPLNASEGDTYPSRVVTVVAPSAPGGLYSVLGRLIASKLEENLKGTFIVENRPGAASVIGSTSVARAAPDGYTLLVASTATLSVNQFIYKKLYYDPQADFVPIAFIARAPEVLVVNADLPVKTLDDLVKLAKENPGKLTFGSAGIGTAQHLEAELLQRSLGISLLHVPYRGAMAALVDVAGNHIQLMFTPVLNALPTIQSGKVRVIGLATDDKIDALPDAMPLSRLGAPNFHADSWFMIVAPAKTPPDIIEKLRTQIATITSDPSFIKNFAEQGLIAAPGRTVDELKKFIDQESEKWSDVIRKAGIAGTQ